MPKSVIFLLIWFFWAAGQDLDLLVRHQIKTDFFIFQHNGLIPLFFVFAVTVFCLNIATIYSIFKRLYMGFYTGITSLLLSTMFSCISYLMALRDIPGVRAVYEKGREIRGLTSREDAMDVMFTEKGMYYAIAVILAFKAIVLFFILKNRKYFVIR